MYVSRTCRISEDEFLSQVNTEADGHDEGSRTELVHCALAPHGSDIEFTKRIDSCKAGLFRCRAE